MEVEAPERGRVALEGRRGPRGRLSEQRRRQEAALRDLRYWLAAVHYNEIVSIQDEVLANQMSAGGKGVLGVVRATRRPLDVPRSEWRAAHYDGGHGESARWDAMALWVVALVALVLLSSRLVLRLFRSPLLYKKRTSLDHLPEDAELSLPVEPSDLVYPPPYSESAPVPGAPASAPGDYPPPPYSESSVHSSINREYYDNVEAATSELCRCNITSSEASEASARRPAHCTVQLSTPTI